MKKFLSVAGLIPIKSGLLLILNSLFIIFNSYSQTPDWLWAKGIGDTSTEDGYSIAIDLASGDVYTTGVFYGTSDFDPGAGIFNMTSFGQVDIFISKLDSSGNFVWAKQISGGMAKEGKSIAIDPINGDVYTTGAFYTTTDFDPGPGIFNLTSAGIADIFICKLDSSGNFVWAKALGGIDDDKGISIAIDPTGSGAVYTTGSFEGTADFDPDSSGSFNLTSAGANDIFISKLDHSGNFLWAKRMGGTYNFNGDIGYCIALDASGNVYTTGYFRGTVDFDPGVGVFNITEAGNNDIFISKLDSSGNFKWAKAMGGPDTDYGYSIAVEPAASGDVYTTGTFSWGADFDPGAGVFNLTSVASDEIFISKLDSSGNFVWAKGMSGTFYDIGASIAIDPAGSGDVYATGFFNETVDFDPGAGVYNITSAGIEDAFISKLDASGNFVWAKAIGGTGQDYGNSIALNTSGSVHVTGSFNSLSIPFGSDTLINTNIYRNIFIARLDNTIITENNEIENIGNRILLFPNPVSNSTTISFSLSKAQNVSFKIFDVSGRLVSTLTNKIFVAGENELTWNVENINAGIYFLHFQSAEIIRTEKLIVTK